MKQSHTFDILVVYAYMGYRIKEVAKDHLYFLSKHTQHRIYYLNAFYPFNLPVLLNINFDLVVFTTFFAGAKWMRSDFAEAARHIWPLKNLSAPKIILPQDEYVNTDVVSDFIRDFGVDIVYSVAAASEWPKIYPSVDPAKTQFQRILTGYLDTRKVAKLNTWVKQYGHDRPIDIGYRAWDAAYWLGRQGQLKVNVGKIMKQHANGAGFKTDISNRAEDIYYGDDWYLFLIRCKYTLGVEGGASLLDVDGSIRKRTEAYMADCLQKGQHPTFAEVEAACFPDVDGNLNLTAIGPRHLEACVTKTCQVLVEGDYQGVLEANKHYIPIKPDFSNIEVVLNQMRDESLRERIVNQAYQDIALSGKYTYPSFVRFLLETSIPNPAPKTKPAVLKHRCHALLHVCIWYYVKLRYWVFHHLPPPLLAQLSKWYQRFAKRR